MSAAVSLSARREARLRGSRPRPPRGWVLPLSLGLHLAVLLLLLFGPKPPPPTDMSLSSPVSMVFQTPQHGRKSTPNPRPIPSLAQPPPASAPVARAVVPPAQLANAAPRPVPAPVRPAAPPLPPAPPVAAVPAPPAATATLPVPPAVVPPPPAPAAPQSQRKMLAMTVPLRPPKLQRRQAAPHQSTQAFPAPMAMSLGKPFQPRRQPQPSSRPSRGPGAQGPNSFGDSVRVVKGHVGPNWFNELGDWIQHHAYYPEQAVVANESGTTVVQFVVDRYGHVLSVARQMSSGSQWLDMETEGMLRDAKVPPLPPDTPDHTVTVDLYMHWVLLP